MEPSKKPPLVFANRIVRMFVDHLAGEDIQVLPDDYTVMRVAFRKNGGSWEPITFGDIKHIRLLSSVIKAWAKMPGRTKITEMG